jgi:hypothetical protein
MQQPLPSGKLNLSQVAHLQRLRPFPTPDNFDPTMFPHVDNSDNHKAGSTPPHSMPHLPLLLWVKFWYGMFGIPRCLLDFAGIPTFVQAMSFSSNGCFFACSAIPVQCFISGRSLLLAIYFTKYFNFKLRWVLKSTPLPKWRINCCVLLIAQSSYGTQTALPPALFQCFQPKIPELVNRFCPGLFS